MRQQLSTVVTLGGAVDSSFSQMAGTVSRELGKSTQQVKKLEREQQKLTKQIRQATLAGADVSLLTNRYQQLGDEITRTSREANGLASLSTIGTGLKSIAIGATAITGVISGVTASMTGLITATNTQTAEQVGLAQAYGMSIEQYKAWGSIAEQAGLNAENTGDLVEELTNKFGEFKALGKQSSVADVFGKLGINKSMLEGLDAAEQFEFVMRRLEKVTDKQQAASLADMLFGGEGNKLVTYLNQSGQSIDVLLKKYKQLNNLTEKGATGAKQFNSSISGLSGVVTSSWAEVSGIVGSSLAPSIESITNKFNNFFKNNKEEVIQFVKDMIKSGKGIAKFAYDSGKAINDVVQSIGGWNTIAALLAGVLAGKLAFGIASTVTGVVSMVQAISSARNVMIGLNAVMMANPIGLVAAGVAALTTAGVLLYQNWDTVTAWFKEQFNWFQITFPEVTETLKNIFNWSPMNMIKEQWGGVTNYFSNLWDSVTSIFNDSLGKVQATWNSISGLVDRLNFWSDEEANKEVSIKDKRHLSNDNQYSQYAERAAHIASNAAPLSSNNNTTVNNIQNHQSVDKIEIHAQKDQSPKAIGLAVATQLSDNRNGAMYDTLSSD